MIYKLTFISSSSLPDLMTKDYDKDKICDKYLKTAI